MRPRCRRSSSRLLVALTHHECDNAVCKQASFTYGSGFPALWRHENLNEETHDWLKQEFASVPLTFFDQMARCVARGTSSRSTEGRPAADFAAQPPQDRRAHHAAWPESETSAFFPKARRHTFEFLAEHRQGRCSLHVLPDYGHLDVFLGKNAVRDMFPLILAALDEAD